MADDTTGAVDLNVIRDAALALENNAPHDGFLALKVPEEILVALDAIGEAEGLNRSKILRQWIGESFRRYYREDWKEVVRQKEEIRALQAQVTEMEFTLHTIARLASTKPAAYHGEWIKVNAKPDN